PPPALPLRLGHALLSGQGAERPRRPHSDAARAGALRVLAQLGARAHPAASDRARRRARRAAAPRAEGGGRGGSRVAVVSVPATPGRRRFRCPPPPARAAGSTTPRTAPGSPRPPS